MLLQNRIKVLLLGLLVICIGSTLFFQYSIVYRSYTRLEQTQASENTRRCVNAIRREGYHLGVLATDWASWDDMDSFVRDRDPAFQKTNLNSEAMGSARLNLLCILDQSNSIVWTKALAGTGGTTLTLQEFSQPTLPPDHPLLARSQTNDSAMILKTEHGLLLVASSPILPTNRQGPAHGTVIMGRFLNDTNIEMLAQQTQVQFVAWNLVAQNLPTDKREISNRLTSDEPLIEAGPEGDTLRGYALLRGIHGRPALLIEATIPSKITIAGRDAVLQACLWIVMTLVIVWAALLGFLNRHVLWPTLRLLHSATTLNPDRDPSLRIPVRRSDEIGSLAAAFNTLLDRLALEKSHPRQTQHQVHQAQDQAELVDTHL